MSAADQAVLLANALLHVVNRGDLTDDLARSLAVDLFDLAEQCRREVPAAGRPDARLRLVVDASRAAA